ncbi:beta-ketoacyl synthase N-terminal-like domain-containing protein [Paractinoplanes rishiriensis]|uniref:Beta-ketoacyl synthase-like N-terminal domain-containing protein n=1 Tax=Paractinoplanes rishiriensis TaxID=1050105 RepID=A0A919N2W5_9ACTN|nr:beta-ketoacyl synthase N-terminal-like domain-containing protein [Actinoplanes rishiriensis]GIF02263.1 hypothetical protein Ari01nite_97270 [Actinoplanes rishiriensis]
MTAGLSLAVTGTGAVLRPAGAPDDWFDVAAELGRRGYKYLPPGAHYLLAAVRRALGAHSAMAAEPDRRGLAVGCHGVLGDHYAAADHTVVTGHADRLSPVTAPFFAVNALAGRVASEQRIQGFTVTTTSPRIAGLEAWETGGRALRAGRCDVLVVATTEHGAGSADGAVAVVLEDAGRAAARGAAVQARCSVQTGLVPATADVPRETGALLRELARRLDLPARIPVLIDSDGSAFAATVTGLVAGWGPVRPAAAGGSGCVPPLRAVCAAVAGAADTVVVSASRTGHVAVARVSGAGEETGA